MTNKQATRIFNRCINRLKSDDYSTPRILRYHSRPHVEALRKRREAILQRFGAPGNHYSEIERYEQEMYAQLLQEILQQVAEKQLPRYREEVTRFRMVLERMELLRCHIETCFPTIRRFYHAERRFDRWKGCKVMVTSDRNARQRNTIDLSGGQRLIVFSDGRGDADFVVVTDNPHPLVWLMQRLWKEEGQGFIDFQNKFEFFGRIATAAQQFLAENSTDDEAGEQRLLLHCLQEPIAMVTEYRDEAQKWLDEFEAYCSEHLLS